MYKSLLIHLKLVYPYLLLASFIHSRLHLIKNAFVNLNIQMVIQMVIQIEIYTQHQKINFSHLIQHLSHFQNTLSLCLSFALPKWN